MAWFEWTGIALVLAVATVAGISAHGASRWNGATRRLLTRLEAGRKPPAKASFDCRDLDSLPAPVQRYFRAVLAHGQLIVAAANVEHEGTFNLGEATDRWTSFTSTQRVVTWRPGFVWDGRIRILPGLPVRVHDAYVAGVGILHPAALGLFTLMDLRGTGEVAQGELMRYLAEAAWYPTALLPGHGVRWEPVDERCARATLTDGALSVDLLFRFGDDSLIESVRSEARGRTVEGRVIPTPWEGRWSDYQRRDGLLVPLSGEVAWLLPEGRKPYWRGTITALSYEFAH